MVEAQADAGTDTNVDIDIDVDTDDDDTDDDADKEVWLFAQLTQTASTYDIKNKLRPSVSGQQSTPNAPPPSSAQCQCRP